MPEIIPKNPKYFLYVTGMMRPKDIEIFPNRFYLYYVDGGLEYAVCNQKRAITRIKIDLKEFDNFLAREVVTSLKRYEPLSFESKTKVILWATAKGYSFDSRFTKASSIGKKTKAVEVYERKPVGNRMIDSGRFFDITNLIDLRQNIAEKKSIPPEKVTEEEIDVELKNCLYGERDFVISPAKDGRSKVSCKLGSLLIEFDPNGKDSYELKIFSLNRVNKTYSLFFSNVGTRYPNFHFESFMPILLESYYSDRTSTGYRSNPDVDGILRQLQTLLIQLALGESVSAQEKHRIIAEFYSAVNSILPNSRATRTKDGGRDVADFVKLLVEKQIIIPKTLFEVSAAIAAIYCMNLGIEEKDIIGIIKAYFSEKKLTQDKDLYEKLVDTLIDQSRYSLQTLLGDNIILIQSSIDKVSQLSSSNFSKDIVSTQEKYKEKDNIKGIKEILKVPFLEMEKELNNSFYLDTKEKEATLNLSSIQRVLVFPEGKYDYFIRPDIDEIQNDTIFIVKAREKSADVCAKWYEVKYELSETWGSTAGTKVLTSEEKEELKLYLNKNFYIMFDKNNHEGIIEITDKNDAISFKKILSFCNVTPAIAQIHELIDMLLISEKEYLPVDIEKWLQNFKSNIEIVVEKLKTYKVFSTGSFFSIESEKNAFIQKMCNSFEKLASEAEKLLLIEKYELNDKKRLKTDYF